MKRAALILAALAVAFAAPAAPVRTATENFVTNKIAEAVAAIPAPDYSTNNAALVETIQAKAPAPGNYAAVSNAAMNAVQTEVDPVWAAEKSGYATVGDINRLNQAKLEVGDFNQSMEAAEERFTSATNELESVLRSAMQNLNSIDGWLDQNAALPQDNRRALADKQDKLPYATNAIPYAAITGKPTNVSAFNNDAGYLTGYTESDPVWAAEKNGYATKTELASAAINATNYTDAATNAIPKFSEKDVVKVYFRDGENYPSYVDGRGELWEFGDLELGGRWVATGGPASSQGTYNYAGHTGGVYGWTLEGNYITYNTSTGEIIHNGSTSTNTPEPGKNPEVIGTTFPTCHNIWASGRTITYYPMAYQYDSKGRFALSNALSKVAFSGNYNDLTNKPSIPTVPANVSAFNNDAGYLTGYTETDPTVPQWAKAQTKPTYTASEVGATTPEDVTAAIREQSLGGIWDETLQVWWTPRMRNGSLTYEATTNVNLNAEN